MQPQRGLILFLLLFYLASNLKAELIYSGNRKVLQTEYSSSLIIKNPPHDYGDRSKLSAFILCAMLGFTGAHHFYMKHYFSGASQLSFFLLSSVLSVFGIAIFFSWLFILALWAWVAADLLLIIFDGLRLKKGKKLIPFEQII
jgi:TM2 domain-containing membrane protein YozV